MPIQTARASSAGGSDTSASTSCHDNTDGAVFGLLKLRKLASQAPHLDLRNSTCSSVPQAVEYDEHPALKTCSTATNLWCTDQYKTAVNLNQVWCELSVTND